MAITFWVVDAPGILPAIRREALRLRSETQHYSDKMDKQFICAFGKLFPQYKRFTYVIAPNEVFQLARKPLSATQIITLKKRMQGFTVWEGKPYTGNEISKLFRREGITFDVPKVTSRYELRGTSASPGLAPSWA